jgi:subtilisin family serine protease
MIKTAIFLTFIILAALNAESKTIRVAVIDTGFNFSFKQYKHFKLTKPKLCKTGQKDFTNSSITDVNGHGSNIVSLIAKGNENTDYCIMVLKYYSKETENISLDIELEALKYAIKSKVDVINLSIAGYAYSKEECETIKLALDKGIRIVAAAGNEGFDLSKTKVYPAMCDRRVKIVMNYDKTTRHYTSNYGNNLIKEQGTNQYGVSDKELPEFRTGTSQATANYTNKLIRNYEKMQ